MQKNDFKNDNQEERQSYKFSNQITQHQAEKQNLETENNNFKQKFFLHSKKLDSVKENFCKRSFKAFY
jgi:hypothetical protein